MVMLLESNSNILNSFFNGEKMVLAYHGVKLENDSFETTSLRSFFVSKQLSEEEIVSGVVQCIEFCGISDYPYERADVNHFNVKEITVPWYPGSMIGYNFSSKLFNADILTDAGVPRSAVVEGSFIGDREWEKEQSGRPKFYCAYGSIEKSAIQKDNEKKLIVLIEYRFNTMKKELLVDIDDHMVIYL